MASNNEKIFRIVVDYKTASENLERINANLKTVHESSLNLQVAEKNLKAAHKEGTVAQGEYNRRLTEIHTQQKENRKSVIALNDEKRKATLETNKLAIAEKAQTGSINELQARLTAMRIKYRELSQEQRNNHAVGGALLKQINSTAAEYKKLEMSIGNTGINVGNYASKLYNKYTAVAATIYGLKETVSALITPFKDFEYQMSRVSAVSGATSEQLKALILNARNLGETTEYTASQVADLQLNYARLGFNPDEILEVTQATLDLATATGEDLAKSADIAGATLRGFSLEAKEMPRVIDVMSESFNKSALSLAYFTDSMKYVAPIAKTAGVSLEQTTAMLGVLADRGIRGSQAGTALRRILTEISLSGKTVSEALADLSAKGLTVGSAMDEVGRYAMTALTVLVENAPKVEVLTNQLGNAAGAAKTAADIMRNNFKGDLDKATSALQEQAIAIGEFLVPVLRVATQLFTIFIQNIKIAGAAIIGYLLTIKDAIILKTLWGNITKVSTIATVAETIATNASTVAFSKQLVMLRDVSAATKLFAAIKLLLTGNIKAATVAIRLFGVAMKSTGIGLAAAALAGLATWLITTRDKTTAAEAAQKRLNAAHEEFDNKQKERKSRSEELITTSKNENETQFARVQAFKELQMLYPKVLQNYTLESFVLADIAKIRQEIAQNEINRKLVADNQALEESTKRVVLLMQELERRKQGSTQESAPEFKGVSIDVIKDQLEVAELELNGFYRIVQKNKENLEAMQPADVRVASIQKNIDEVDRQIKTMEAMLSQGKFVSSFDLKSAKDYLESLTQQRDTLASTSGAVKDLRSELNKLSTEQLEEKRSSGSDDEKKIAKEILKQRQASEKAAKEAEKQAKEQTDTLFAIMEAGRAKDIQAVERDYSDKRAKLKNNAEGLKQLDIWKIGELQKVNDKYDNEALQKLEAQQSFMLSIMEEGTQKELYALNIEYTKKLAVATKNGYDTIKVEEWKQEQLDKIARKAREKEEQPENMRSDKLIKARQDYELQQQIINGSQASPLEKQKNNVANELQYLQVRYDIIKSYIAEAQAMQTTQGYSQERDEQIQKALGMLNTLQVDIDSVTSQANQTSAFAKMLGIDDDSAEQLKQQAISLASEIGQSILSIQSDISQRKLKNEQKRIDDEANSEKKVLADKKKRGLISEKKYQSELERIDAEADKKRDIAERAAFEREKKLKLLGIAMNVAMGVVGIWSQAWLPVKIPFAIAQTAFLVASGIAQSAVIASQKYALGGVVPVGESGDGISMGQVKGPSHAQGGLRIMIGGKPVGEMEGDEIFAIINKTSSNRYLPQLSKINQAGGGVKFADGGLVSMSALPLTSSYTQSMGMPVNFNAFGRFSLDRLPTPAPIPNYRVESERVNNERWESMKRESDARFAAMIDKIETIATQKVYVVESDISDAQKSVANIKKAAIF